MAFYGNCLSGYGEYLSKREDLLLVLRMDHHFFSQQIGSVFSLIHSSTFLLLSPLYDQYCKDHFSDGHCDQGCNNFECEWDGLDCANNMPEKLADGTLVVVVLITPENLKNNSFNFLRELSRVLHTNVVFKKNPKGEYMIFPYYGNEEELKKHYIKRSTEDWSDMPSAVINKVKSSLYSRAGRRPKRELDQMDIRG